MRYTTVTVGLVTGHEHEDINAAIAQGLKELSGEIDGPVELVNVAYVPVSGGVCVTVMAKPYRPPIRIVSGTSIQDTLREFLNRQ